MPTTITSKRQKLRGTEPAKDVAAAAAALEKNLEKRLVCGIKMIHDGASQS
jgi:hypothetical protein